jgi:hypothetical protein
MIFLPNTPKKRNFSEETLFKRRTAVIEFRKLRSIARQI